MRERQPRPTNPSAGCRDARIPPVTAAASQIVRLVVPGVAAFTAAAVGVLAGAQPELADPCRARDRVHAAHTFEPVRRARALHRARIRGRDRALPGPECRLRKFGVLWASLARVRRGAWRRACRFPVAAPDREPRSGRPMLSWIALSQLWAETRAETVDSLLRLTLNVILAVVIFTAVRKPGQAIGVTAAFVVGATVNAIYGLLFVEPRREPPRRPAWRAGSATQRARDHPGGRTHRRSGSPPCCGDRRSCDSWRSRRSRSVQQGSS